MPRNAVESVLRGLLMATAIVAIGLLLLYWNLGDQPDSPARCVRHGCNAPLDTGVSPQDVEGMIAFASWQTDAIPSHPYVLCEHDPQVRVCATISRASVGSFIPLSADAVRQVYSNFTWTYVIGANDGDVAAIDYVYEGPDDVVPAGLLHGYIEQ